MSETHSSAENDSWPDWKAFIDTFSVAVQNGFVHPSHAVDQAGRLVGELLRSGNLESLAALQAYLEERHPSMRIVATPLEAATRNPGAYAADPRDATFKPYAAMFIISLDPEHTALHFGEVVTDPAQNLARLESETGFLVLPPASHN
jgi:hypothetical protein